MTYLLAALRLLLRIPYGLLRMVTATWAWCTDARYAAVYENAIANATKHTEIEANRKTRADRRRKRICGLIMILGLTTIGLLLADGYLGGGIIWQALTAIVLVTAAGIGKPRQKVHVTAISDKPEPPKALTSESVTNALTVALPSIAKATSDEPKSLQLRGPVMKDGPGWAAKVNLPPGITVEDVSRNKTRVASALQIPTARLYLNTGSHAGQVEMWVADNLPEDLPPVEWALADKERISLTALIPIGVTPKGDPVTLSLRTKSPDGKTIAGGSMLVGGVSGSGKTTFMRLLVSAAAMDPDAAIAIFDGKGDGDYDVFEPVCEWMRVGASPDNLADLHAMLVEAQAEMERRQKGLAPKTPLLIVIDEVQRVKNKDTQDVIEDLLRIGRSSGIFMLLATQKPSAETLPTDLRDSTRTRVCLKVHNQQTNDMILGTGAYADGRSAKNLTIGMALVLDVDTDVANLVRVANVTNEIAEAIAARHKRQTGSVFTNSLPAPPKLTFLDHVRAVWPEGRDRASCAELAVALSDRSGEFQGWEAADVTKALKPYGIETRGINTDNGRVRGLFRHELDGVPVEA